MLPSKKTKTKALVTVQPNTMLLFFPREQPAGVHLVRVQTSPNDRMLWALDSRCNVHVRTGITDEMPVGTAWEHIPGTPLFNFIYFVSSSLLLIC